MSVCAYIINHHKLNAKCSYTWEMLLHKGFRSTHVNWRNHWRNYKCLNQKNWVTLCISWIYLVLSILWRCNRPVENKALLVHWGYLHLRKRSTPSNCFALSHSHESLERECLGFHSIRQSSLFAEEETKKEKSSQIYSFCFPYVNQNLPYQIISYYLWWAEDSVLKHTVPWTCNSAFSTTFVQVCICTTFV